METVENQHHDADFKLLEMINTATGMKMFGGIYNDSKNRFEDGEMVRTSTVERITPVDDHLFVYTKNTVYRIVGYIQYGSGE